MLLVLDADHSQRGSLTTRMSAVTQRHSTRVLTAGVFVAFNACGCPSFDSGASLTILLTEAEFKDRSGEDGVFEEAECLGVCEELVEFSAITGCELTAVDADTGPSDPSRRYAMVECTGTLMVPCQ